MQSAVGRCLRLRHVSLIVLLTIGLYYGFHNTKSTSMTTIDSKRKGTRKTEGDNSLSADVMTHDDSYRPSLAHADVRCNMTSSLSADQGRHVVNVPEANRLVQRFQLDWNLQLPGDQQTPWKLANRWVSPTHIYPEHSPEMGAVLRSLATAKIEKATYPGKFGHNFKLMLVFSGGHQALFKVKTYGRDHVHRKSFCLMKDSNVGDIVAFHLSRILGFRKAPLAVGRTLDLHKEIIPVASPDLLRWIIKTGNKTCLARQVCITGDQVEGVAILWLPENVTLSSIPHPWGRMCRAVEDGTFHYFKPGIHSPEAICREAQAYQPFLNKPALFLDLVDSTIVEYLVQNTDRQINVGTGKYEHFLAMIDSGKSFSNPAAEYEKILAPLYHCCLVRESTYRSLQSFQNGTLSYVLDVLTQKDPVYPLLTSDHLQALDRRLHKVLAHIHLCICKHGRQSVLLNL